MKRAITIAASVLAGIALLTSIELPHIGNAINQRVVAKLRSLTGPRTDVASLQFRWRDRALDLSGVVVRGGGGSAALSAPRVHIRLPLAAFFGRTNHISELDIESPEIAWNPQQTLKLSDLKQIRIDRLRVRDGILHAATTFNAPPGRRLPVDIDASGVQFDVRERLVNCKATSVRIIVNRKQTIAGAFELTAKADDDGVSVSRASFESGTSWITAQGKLETSPDLHGNITFSSHLEEPALPFLAGTINSGGAVHIGSGGLWQVSGSASGQNISFRDSPYPPLAFLTSFTADDQTVQLEGLRASNAAASFAGSAEVKNWSQLTASGSVQNIDIQQALKHWAPSSRWTGKAAGNVRLTAVLNPATLNTVHMDLRVSPGQAGIPVTGTVSASYSGRMNTIRVEQLELTSAGMHLTCSGTAAALNVHLQSSKILDLDPLLVAVAGQGLSNFRSNLEDTDVQFDGTVAHQHLHGALLLHRVTTNNLTWKEVRATADADSGELRLANAKLISSDVQASVTGRVALHKWLFDPEDSSAEFVGRVKINKLLGVSDAVAQFSLGGLVRDPVGRISVAFNGPEILGQTFTGGNAWLDLSRGLVTVTSGQLKSGHSVIGISGTFEHPVNTFENGRLILRVQTSDFRAAIGTPVHAMGSVSAAGTAAFAIADSVPHLSAVTGTVTSPQLQIADTSYTDVSVSAKDDAGQIAMHGVARFAGEPLRASVELDPTHGYVMHASVAAKRVDIQTIAAALRLDFPEIAGTVAGTADVDGPLGNPSKWHAKAVVTDIAVQRSVSDTTISLHSAQPAVLEIANGTAHIDNLTMNSPQGELSAQGDVGLTPGGELHLAVNGGIGLQAFEIFDPNVVSSGEANMKAAISGTVERPLVNGTLAVRNGSLSLKNVQASITDVQAQIQFNRNRATITSLTGASGGGQISADGFVTYGEGRPLTYNVKAVARDTRYRYANAIGVTGDSTLRLAGTTANGLLSGAVQLSRIVVSPELDLAGLLISTAAARQSVVERRNLMSGLQLDIHVSSQPNLQVSTAIARDVEANVDLRLRGTPDRPLVFGSITANQGDLRIFGEKYSINRCQITFANTTRVEPIVDLDLETQSRGIAVDITIAGALDKLSMTYRSDPPLQPRDIIALLTVGKPPSFDPSASAQPGTNDFRPLQAGANTVLGQAIAPGSNGLSKLFGITNIKIDPLVQGLTNTPQSRLTIEQQISKNVTVTYVTNLAQTSEQIFRFEWALNPQYSMVAVRDDNGEFGIDLQYKKRFH